ncbi:MAG: (2Fe-2S)-binding protein [Candidatus Wallbacteria bacterium]|nr:(2Fe-2S)-binding protein [Candidatus Wallbacteria bacterium]
MKLEMKLNGQDVSLDIAGPELLLDLLRDNGYFGSKRGCENGDCGACTVLVDGKAVCSCMYFAGQAHGREVTTIEGLGTMEHPHPLQETFVECGAVQCGFCIPGMLMSAKELLDECPNPKDPEIREALDGNLCRCTGYTKQFEAVKLTAKRMAEGTGKGRDSGRKSARGGKSR